MNHAPIIVLDKQGAVTTLTLNSPNTLNALSLTMIEAVIQALHDIALDSTCRALVLAAKGKAFSAGHNLKDMAAMPVDQTQYAQLFKLCSHMMLAIQKLPQPVIAKVRGIATAAGCQLVGACDLAVAADSAQFATSGINVGLFCATPSVTVLRNVARKHAMYMLLTGDFITAQQAQDWALINQCVPDDQLDTAVQALCASIIAKPAESIRLGKHLIYQQSGMSEPAAYQLAGQVMAHNLTLDCAQEGVHAFIDKRSPCW